MLKRNTITIIVIMKNGSGAFAGGASGKFSGPFAADNHLGS